MLSMIVTVVVNDGPISQMRQRTRVNYTFMTGLLLFTKNFIVDADAAAYDNDVATLVNGAMNYKKIVCLQ